MYVTIIYQTRYHKNFFLCVMYIINFSHDNAITISCSLEVFFLRRLRYKNKIAAQRSRWHLHSLPRDWISPGGTHTLSLLFSLFRSVSISLSALFSRIFFRLGPRDIDSQVFEWGGIIKRRTSNSGIQRNLIFRTKSIDLPIGRARRLRQKRRASGNARTTLRKTGATRTFEDPPRPND